MPTVGRFRSLRGRFLPALLLVSGCLVFPPCAVFAGSPPPDEDEPAIAQEAATSAPVVAPILTAGEKARLISGAGVRLRERPSTSGKELRRLTLGTEVTELERSNREETLSGASAPWIKVRTSEGNEGWIFGSFCRPLVPASRQELIRSLANDRLAEENLAEGDARELFGWMERLLAAKPAPAPALEYTLARLQALQKILDALSRREKNRFGESDLGKDPQLAKLEKDLVWNEPGASWLVRADCFWDLYEANRSSPIAERIAWVAARQMLPGESEGYIPAVIARKWMTVGRYLEEFPRGEHAGKVIADLVEVFATIDSIRGQEEVWNPKTADQSEVSTLKTQLAKLRDSVDAASPGPEQNKLREMLAAFSKGLD